MSAAPSLSRSAQAKARGESTSAQGAATPYLSWPADKSAATGFVEQGERAISALAEVTQELQRSLEKVPT